MNLPAVNHRPTQEFIYPASRNELILQLFTAAKDIDEVTLLYWERYEQDPSKIHRKKLSVSLRDDQRDCYRTSIRMKSIAAYIRYCFELKKGTETIWYGRNGFDESFRGMNESFFEFLWPNPTDGFRAPKWAASQIYYQIFPERFCNGDNALSPKQAVAWASTPTRENYMGGDIPGIIKQLPYLSDLGITCLYLTPIFEGSSNHKYDTVDYYKIDPQFGTEKELHALITEAHALNIRILLDGVFNHCGFYFPYFQDVVEKGQASQYSRWFFVQSYPIKTDPCTYDCVGHYKWMPKLNLANEAVQNYFTEVGLYWIREFGIDGWRLDVADEMPTKFLEHFAATVKEKYPDALLLGETWGDADRLVSGNRLDCAMNYLFKDAVTDWIAKDKISVSTFDQRINRMLSLYPQETNLRMYNPLDSHDTARFLFSCGNDIARLRLGVALQMTLPGCPAIFYGDEIGITGDNDPLCRQAMQWDKSKQDLHTKEWYKKLIRCRRNSNVLQEGNFHTLYVDDENGVYAFSRSVDNDVAIIILNTGTKEIQIPPQKGPTDKTLTVLFNESAAFSAPQNKLCSETKCSDEEMWTTSGCSVKILTTESEGVTQ